MSGQQNSKVSIRQHLMAANSLLLNSISGEFALREAGQKHRSLIKQISDGYFEAALDDLENAAGRYEPDGKALPAEFWALVAAAADDLGWVDRAADLRAKAG